MDTVLIFCQLAAHTVFALAFEVRSPVATPVALVHAVRSSGALILAKILWEGGTQAKASDEGCKNLNLPRQMQALSAHLSILPQSAVLRHSLDHMESIGQPGKLTRGCCHIQ